MWTVSEDYLAEGFEIFGRDEFYELSIIGYAFKKYELQNFLEFSKINITKVSNHFDMMSIAFLILDFNVKAELLKTRPGIISIREEYKRKVTRKDPKSFADEIVKWYYLTEDGSFPKTHDNIVNILRLIRKKKIEDTNELIELLVGIFKSYFHMERGLDLKKMEDSLEKLKTNPKFYSQKKSKRKFLDDFELERYTIMSSEFFEESYENLKVVMETAKGGSGENDYQNIVKKHFGKNILNEIDSLVLESALCTGIHSKIKIHMTDGSFEKESYYKSLIENSREENREYFEKNALTYKRGIKNLKEIIKNSLLKESEHYKITSTSGEVVAHKLWKIDRTNDNRVFKKEFTNDYGDLIVDILLDSSASQHERSNEVATQGYIIASALTELNVKTRVIGFNNLFNYQILNIYRDYEDPKYKNREIFRYYPTGSNRDGLAIKTMVHLMKKKDAERKILIVLSDGKPNDEINIASLGKKKLEALDYVGDLAIYDTSMEVMNAKNIGINVLGVFTGEFEDLKSEKMIYGNDFSYIKDMERFSQIVGLFFKSVANNLS